MRTDTNEQADFQPKPYFATAGNPAQFFVVSDDTTTECALEGASMFLSSAERVNDFETPMHINLVSNDRLFSSACSPAWVG